MSTSEGRHHNQLTCTPRATIRRAGAALDFTLCNAAVGSRQAAPGTRLPAKLYQPLVTLPGDLGPYGFNKVPRREKARAPGRTRGAGQCDIDLTADRGRFWSVLRFLAGELHRVAAVQLHLAEERARVGDAEMTNTGGCVVCTLEA
jgi:hypothetical protein